VRERVTKVLYSNSIQLSCQFKHY